MIGEKRSDVSPGRGSRSRLLAALAVAVVLRLGFHAVFVPAWEGPDEPMHASRVLAAVRKPLRGSLENGPLDPEIAGSIGSHPCSALARYFPCPAFGAERAVFNLLVPAAPSIPTPGGRNPENNQPPLFYFLSGVILSPIRAVLLGSPERALLGCRLLGFAFVVLAIFGPLRRLARARPPSFAFAGLLLLALPGASESVVRCANESAIFLWTAVVVDLLEADAPPAALCVLLAAGPLIKLTALPVAAVAVGRLWFAGRRGAAGAALASTAVVFPVQLLRGWRLGGGLEANRTLPALAESWVETAVGLARSAYAFVKTVFWMGEWSAFRAPLALVLAWFLLILLLWAASRLRPEPRFGAAHAVGALVLATGTAVFFVACRRYWGQWGGVGGWYVWGWMPWLAVAWDDAFAVSKRAVPVLLAASAAFVVVCNVLYFRAALALYG